MKLNASGRPLRPDAPWEVRHETWILGADRCIAPGDGWLLLHPDPRLYATARLRALHAGASIRASGANVPPICACRASDLSTPPASDHSAVSSETTSGADSARVADHSGILYGCWRAKPIEMSNLL
jgi:hypothetical protein